MLRTAKASCACPSISSPLCEGSHLPLQVLYDSPSNTTAAVSPPAQLLPANLTSAECSERPDCYFGASFSKPLQYMFIYHFYGLLWANQFNSAFG